MTIKKLMEFNHAFQFNKEATLYVRMSTDAQLDGNSLQRQLEAGFNYANRNAFKITNVLDDIGLSAHTGDNLLKGKLGTFVESANKGAIPRGTAFIVESLDRLSRKHIVEAMPALFNLVNSGIEIHTTMDGTIYSQETLKNQPALFIDVWVKQGVAFEESNKKSNRGLNNWAKKYSNLENQIATARCPAWLKVDKKRNKFIVLAEHANVVRTIFDLCINQNMGVYQITRYLNHHHDRYPKFTLPLKKYRDSQGKSKIGWARSYISKILHNPAVYGEFTPHRMENKKRVPRSQPLQNYYPVIISKDRFLLAQSCIKRRAVQGGGRKGDNFKNIFTKKLSCSCCGAPFHFINKGTPPKGGTYLACYNSLSKGPCKVKPWRYSEFEGDFLRFISDFDLEKIFLSPHLFDSKLGHQESLDTINEKISNLEIGIQELLVDFSTGPAAKYAKQRIEHSAEQIEALKLDRLAHETALQKLSVKFDKTYQNTLLDLFYRNQLSLPPEDQIRIRREINRQIDQAIDTISISTSVPKFQVWDDIEECGLAEREIKYILDQHNLTLNQLPDFLQTTIGQKVWYLAHRVFIVHFKNGVTKTVKPYFEKVFRQDNSRMISFLDSRTCKTF